MKNNIIWDLINKVTLYVYNGGFSTMWILNNFFIYKIKLEATDNFCEILHKNEQNKNIYVNYAFMYFKTQDKHFYMICKLSDSEWKKLQEDEEFLEKAESFEFSVFNNLLKTTKIIEIGIIFQSDNTVPLCSKEIMYFFTVCEMYKIKPFIVIGFYKENNKYKICPVVYENKNYITNVKSFIEYSLLEEKGLVDPEFPIDTKNFNFFMDHINGWNDLDINGYWRGTYQDLFYMTNKDKVLFGVIALASLSLEDQARFIYDFWYMQLPLVDNLGVGVAHWKKDEFVFAIESKGDNAFLKLYINFLVKKEVSWLDHWYRSIYAFIKSELRSSYGSSSFNKYYLGVFDDSVARRSFLRSIKYSFDNYYMKIKNAYDFNEELKLDSYEEVSDADPDIYYKFPKACYKYLGCKGLSETLWISEPIELFELVVEEVVEMKDENKNEKLK